MTIDLTKQQPANVFIFLNNKDVANCMLVSKGYKQATHAPVVAKQLLKSLTPTLFQAYSDYEMLGKSVIWHKVFNDVAKMASQKIISSQQKHTEENGCTEIVVSPRSRRIIGIMEAEIAVLKQLADVQSLTILENAKTIQEEYQKSKQPVKGQRDISETCYIDDQKAEETLSFIKNQQKLEDSGCSLDCVLSSIQCGVYVVWKFVRDLI